MKVGALIQLLSQVDPETEVWTAVDHHPAGWLEYGPCEYAGDPDWRVLERPDTAIIVIAGH